MEIDDHPVVREFSLKKLEVILAASSKQIEQRFFSASPHCHLHESDTVGAAKGGDFDEDDDAEALGEGEDHGHEGNVGNQPFQALIS